MPLEECSDSEKVYHFISDPGHKENLSGRVRAACITCRRKKIKCSGEVPCSTCQEKGIACEGITERKRPKKNCDHLNLEAGSSFSRTSTSSSSSFSPGARGSSEHFVNGSNAVTPSNRRSNRAQQRPMDTLRKLDTVRRRDSGYASGRRTSREDSASGKRPQLDVLLSINSTLATRESLTELSPTITGLRDWSFVQRQGNAHSSPTEAAESDKTQVASAAASTKSVEWPDPRDRSTWWSDHADGDQAATSLISAARALEEQAQSLRRLASRTDPTVADDARRQTIAFPSQSAADVSIECAELDQQTAFDDLALLLADRTPGSGLTPMAADYASLWDTNPDIVNDMVFQQPSRILKRVAGTAHLSETDALQSGWQYSVGQNTRSASPAPSQRLGQQFVSAGTTNSGTRHVAENSHLDRHFPSMTSYGELYPWPE